MQHDIIHSFLFLLTYSLNLNFSYLHNGIWFIALVLVFALTFLVYRQTKNVLTRWFDAHTYYFSYPLAKFLLRFLGTGFAFLALLGPYWGKSDKNVNLLGREIYILLDVSSSMNVNDVKPSRLDKAKKEIHRLINDMKGDPIGLIVFSKHAYVQCPITYDYKALNMFLDLAETGQFAETGTDLRAGLLMCLDRFLNVEKRSDRISRAVVVISDGEDFGETYASILDRLRRAGVTVFVVGVGTNEGGAVPDLVNGKLRGHKRRPDGSVAVSIVNDAILSPIAERFSTPYTKLDDASANLSSLSQSIKTLSTSALSTRLEKVENSKYAVFVALALLCWAISLFLMPMQKVGE